MKYRKIAPTAELTQFVECFFEWEGDAPERLEVQSPPNCRGAIVFNYGDPTWAYQHDIPETQVPEAFLCGLFTTNYHRVLRGRIGMFGAVFHATALHNLFGIRMSTVVNGRMPLELLNSPDVNAMVEDVRRAKDGEERSTIVGKWLQPMIAAGRGRISIIDEAVDYIGQKDGRVTIEDVAEKFKISKRYLEKQCLVKVGVSPKFFARLRRFTKLSLKVAYSDSVDWQEMVEEAGFHDQSHMVKEFLEFNKQTPVEYLEGHHEMIRLVKKK